MRGRNPLLLLTVSVLILVLAHPFWLPFFGEHLVAGEAPSQAQAAVVLAGDSFGHRILGASDLLKSGYIPRVYVSGPMPFYEQNEADLAIAMAARHGYPKESFSPIYMKADSTREEAVHLINRLREDNVRKFLVVTSNFHTRRTGRVFRSLVPKLFPGAEFHVVASPTEYFRPATWWKSRPSRKITFMEWMKTVADWMGI